MANVVYMDKVIWERSFGRMNNSNPTAPKLSSSTVFPIASVTKVLTVSLTTVNRTLIIFLVACALDSSTSALNCRS